ncbi:MAG TPA: hypothetical protein VK485_09615 [Sphingomicrobium sp.]|nr:hypothetical protein [Sphingomicrobium sp.]
MPGYRLYFMDIRGHIAHAREFVANDDITAIENANESSQLAPMELWCRHRRVQQWDSVPPAKSSPA